MHEMACVVGNFDLLTMTGSSVTAVSNVSVSSAMALSTAIALGSILCDSKMVMVTKGGSCTEVVLMRMVSCAEVVNLILQRVYCVFAILAAAQMAGIEARNSELSESQELDG